MVKNDYEINKSSEKVLNGFLDAAQQFCEDFKEEIEKEKEEYLKRQGTYK